MGTALKVDFVMRRLIGREEAPDQAPDPHLSLVLVPFHGIIHPERERVIDLMRSPQAALDFYEQEFVERVLMELFHVHQSATYASRRRDYFNDMETVQFSDHWVTDVKAIVGSDKLFDRLKTWVDIRAAQVLVEKGVTGEASERYLDATMVAHRLAFQILYRDLIDQLPQHQLRII